MEVRIELKEIINGREYRQTRSMTLDYILMAAFPQHVFYDELMKAVAKIQEAIENAPQISGDKYLVD